MTKEQVVNGMTRVIKRIAKEKHLNIVYSGTGHGYDGTVWKNLGMKDESGIPSIKAMKDGFSIEMRSSWEEPELDIRRDAPYSQDLLVLKYSDFWKDGTEYDYTGNFVVSEVRVDARDYISCINELYCIIDEIEREG